MLEENSSFRISSVVKKILPSHFPSTIRVDIIKFRFHKDGGECHHPLVFSRDGERKTRLVREFSFNVFNHLMKTRGIRNPLPFKLPHNCGGKNRIAYKLTKSRLIVRPRSPEWVNVN